MNCESADYHFFVFHLPHRCHHHRDFFVFPDDLLLQEDLIQIWPMISEANAMSEELDKKVKFEIALIAPVAKGKKDGRTEV